MQTRDGITYMTVPETEIDIEKFDHAHSEGNLVFGKYRGVDTVVDRRRQVFCHFATCSTLYDDYGLYSDTYKWRLVENEKRFEFCDYRINGQVSRKHTFTKGTWFKTVKLGYVIQIYAQFPTYGYFGTEMSNTVKTTDKNEEATGYVGYKLNRDPEINTDKFKLTTIVNDTVFGIYNNEHVSIDRHYVVFCMFVDVTLNDVPSEFRLGKWYKVNNTGDFVVTVDQQHWLFSKNATVPKGSVVKFDRKESGTGYTMKIQVAARGLAYFGTELFNKIEPVKENDMTSQNQTTSAIDFVEIPDEEIDIEQFKLINKNPSSSRVDGIYKGQRVYIDKRRQVFCHFGKCRTISTTQNDIPKDEWIFVNNSFTYNLHDFVLSTQNVDSKPCHKSTFVTGTVFKFKVVDNGLDIRMQANGIDYHGTELKNKLQTQKEKPVTKEQSKSPSFTLSDMLTQSNIGDVVGVYGPNETTVFVKTKEPALLNSYICDANGNKWVLSNRNLKPVNRNESNIKPEERILSKEEAIQADKESTSLLGTSPFDSLLDLANVMSTESLFKRICKQVGLEYPDVPTEAFIRKAFSKIRELDVTRVRVNLVQEADITFTNGDRVVLFLETTTDLFYKELYMFTGSPTEQKALQTTTTNKMTTPTEPDYFKAALKADEQFSIDSNAKYAKFDYEKGSLPNSKLIKDETFKEYNEPVKPFSIDLFDKLTTYVPVISPVWYKDFARAGFCNTDDVNSFVSMDANGNPWFIVETPKVVKPIEKEPVVISHVLNTVDDLCNNTIPAKFCLITGTKQVYQMLSELEYKQYRQSQFAKGNPVVESIIDKTDQIWVKISM